MKCTYLYNHAIYFNQTLHKLSKQSGLSNYKGQIDDLWSLLSIRIFHKVGEWVGNKYGIVFFIMQLPPRENRDDLYAILNWFSKD